MDRPPVPQRAGSGYHIAPDHVTVSPDKAPVLPAAARPNSPTLRPSSPRPPSRMAPSRPDKIPLRTRDIPQAAVWLSEHGFKQEVLVGFTGNDLSDLTNDDCVSLLGAEHGVQLFECIRRELSVELLHQQQASGERPRVPSVDGATTVDEAAQKAAQRKQLRSANKFRSFQPSDWEQAKKELQGSPDVHKNQHEPPSSPPNIVVNVAQFVKQANSKLPKPNQNGPRFGGVSCKCKYCKLPVYPTEMITYNDMHFHENCFKCLDCGSRVPLTEVSMIESHLYCTWCFISKFRRKGGKYRSFVFRDSIVTPHLHIDEPIEPTTDPSKLQGLGKTTQYCQACKGPVYSTEKLEYNTMIFHPTCFTCMICKKPVPLVNVAMIESHLYCQNCFVTHFKKGGGHYDGLITRDSIMSETKQENKDRAPPEKTTSKAKQVIATLAAATPGSSKPMCVACNKAVFPTEMIEYDKRIWHTQCFKCTGCSCHVPMANVCMMEGQLHCRSCFVKTFSRTGGYTRFGGPPKWEPRKTAPKKAPVVAAKVEEEDTGPRINFNMVPTVHIINNNNNNNESATEQQQSSSSSSSSSSSASTTATTSDTAGGESKAVAEELSVDEIIKRGEAIVHDRGNGNHGATQNNNKDEDSDEASDEDDDSLTFQRRALRQKKRQAEKQAAIQADLAAKATAAAAAAQSGGGGGGVSNNNKPVATGSTEAACDNFTPHPWAEGVCQECGLPQENHAQ